MNGGGGDEGAARGTADEVPKGNEGRLARMRSMAGAAAAPHSNVSDWTKAPKDRTHMAPHTRHTKTYAHAKHTL